MKPRIQPVRDNTEKQQTYRKLISRFTQAMRYGFYCEAIMIDYAMIEDRLRSTLYHMGLFANRQATGIWKNNRPVLQDMVTKYKRKEETCSLGVNAMNGKLKIIRSVLLWAVHAEGDYRENRYLTALKSQLEGTDIGLFLGTLDKIDAWKACRNEIVHAMMNKNIDTLEEQLKPVAEEGMLLARTLDSQERILKEWNRVRKSANLPLN